MLTEVGAVFRDDSAILAQLVLGRRKKLVQTLCVSASSAVEEARRTVMKARTVSL